MTWIVFDYGEVIAHRPPASDFARLAEMAGAPAEEFAEGYWLFRDKFDRGMPALDYWQAVGAEARVTVGPDEAEALSAADVELWNTLDPQSVELVADLAAAGRRLALLSNAPIAHGAAFRTREWAAPFEHFVISGELGVAKPDAAIWQALLDQLRAPAREVFFLDDREVNVAAAREAGIRAFLWTGAGDARRHIAEFDAEFPPAAGY
ncbi:HAD-superfamily hydrolase, subfamily IA, variant 3 [Catenulispora acidiphila DSM 44928]|uniref:HAD-superfamily hydrolase, subfamily IA, variant 3 n=1 Tax=Catenulispora acidiphila (strain DSM 44928 / JCM 14897 / NBRC 102108 / NRRL B-24433 / ID139908) TaxID=479433 RepID=C7QFJ8_CATAD|nr:HAD family phosphatase [Catenulispora acidiphila]ACU76775.1 HAD-superfamily hydrolase, subfamily IA, variant 3 [Catenulispora acidiphila DSM 44928]